MNAERKSKSPSSKVALRRALGMRIVQARKRRGWSQTSLAARMEVTRKQLGNWERGIYTPSLEALVKLAEALEVTCEELIKGGRPAAPRIPPAERSEAARCLNGFLRAIRPWLQPPRKEEE